MNRTASRLYTIFFGLFILTLSSLYSIPGGFRLNLLLYPQIGVFSVLGFFHAWNLMSFKDFQTNSPKNNDLYSVLDFISDWLIYTAWYNVILFPYSGFGVIEYIVLFLVLISTFLSDLTSAIRQSKLNFAVIEFLGSSPLTLLITGTALYLLKITVFYLLPSNIYLVAFQGNFLARTIIVFVCVCGLILLISLLVKNIKQNFKIKEEQNNKNKAAKIAKKAVNGFVKGIKKAFQFLATLFSGPVAFIILAIVLFLIVTIAAGFALNIYNSILKFVEPLTEQLLKTGKSQILPSKFYGICQTVSLVSILFFSAFTIRSLTKKPLPQSEVAVKN